ncbi:MAG: Ppx/GppA family phosphatase, partial [Peptostreptococcus porci]|nr:Ppx/GppA family phosphatase [Peptostreptococcus porci]
NQKLENYSMEKIHLSEVTIDDIKSQVQEIRSMTSDDRENIKGLQKKRSKIILAGEYILMEIMDSLQKNKIIVSEFDNLEGYILFSK